MSQPSLANYIVKRPWLKRWMQPLANWYCNAAGYRKLGLRYGDLRCTLKSNWDGSTWCLQYGCSNWELCWCSVQYRADDLIPEESETVLLALKRLPQKEAYDRVYRLRRAFQVRFISPKWFKLEENTTDNLQCSVAHQLLPKEQHTKPEDVCHPRQPSITSSILTTNLRTTHICHRSSRKLRLKPRNVLIWRHWQSPSARHKRMERRLCIFGVAMH